MLINVNGGRKMIKNLISQVESLTALVISLLALAIVVSLLVGASNMAFFGGVVTNITELVSQLGSSGLAGLISLGIILYLFKGN